MAKAPIVMISSYPPRLCGIATFCEEAREFIAKANPDRTVLVISHKDGTLWRPWKPLNGFPKPRARGRTNANRPIDLSTG